MLGQDGTITMAPLRPPARGYIRQRQARRPIGARRLRTRPLTALLALVALLIGLVASARPAAAHAALASSDPPANAVLATAPAQVTLRFTERLERGYSRALLYDQTGAAVAGAASRAGDLPLGVRELCRQISDETKFRAQTLGAVVERTIPQTPNA